MSLAQIGEFSFIIAGLGVAMGVTRHFLYAVAVAVSAVTTLSTPWLVRAVDPVAAYIDRKLPQPLQTFTALYGTWLERLRAGPATRRTGRIRRVVRLLVLDAAVLAALVFVVAIGLDEATAFLQNAIGLAPNAARVVVIGGGYALALPLIIGIGRLSRRLGSTLAIAALPRASGKVDLDAAPRRALVVTLQLAVA
ncbi:MAG: cation:proton antiporter, partial [Longimicrobiales bacterium]